ncbi:MAG: hypothetical protein GZ093_14340 [Rhodoferax sp.]|nr:hypothetical protein [Rhodoferax sp.]
MLIANRLAIRTTVKVNLHFTDEVVNVICLCQIIQNDIALHPTIGRQVTNAQIRQGATHQRKRIAINMNHVNEVRRIIEFRSFADGATENINLTKLRELPQTAR